MTFSENQNRPLACLDEEALKDITAPANLNSGELQDVYRLQTSDFDEPETLEVFYNDGKGGTLREIVFVDPIYADRRPRICVSIDGIQAMHKTISTLTRKGGPKSNPATATLFPTSSSQALEDSVAGAAASSAVEQRAAPSEVSGVSGKECSSAKVSGVSGKECSSAKDDAERAAASMAVLQWLRNAQAAADEHMIEEAALLLPSSSQALEVSGVSGKDSSSAKDDAARAATSIISQWLQTAQAAADEHMIEEELKRQNARSSDTESEAQLFGILPGVPQRSQRG